MVNLPAARHDPPSLPIPKGQPDSQNRAKLQKALDLLEELLEAGITPGNLAEVERLTRMIDRLRVALGAPPESPPSSGGDSTLIGGDVDPGVVIGNGSISAEKIARTIVDARGGIYVHHLDRLAVDENQDGSLLKETTPASRAERSYLIRLLTAARRVPLGQLELRAVEGQDHMPEIRLDHIYVPLDTTQTQHAIGGQGGARAPIPALSAAIGHRRLVILGDPGSGKTTFINYLTLCLAQARLDPASGALERLNVPGGNGQKATRWRYDALLPVRVDLCEFAQELPPDTKAGECGQVWKHITGHLAAHHLAEFTSLLKKALDEGHCLVMFDGLDEVPDAKRKIVRDAVTDFANDYPESRFIVTCRALSYSDPAWQLPDFLPVTLAPLSRASIHCFIDGWYAALARQQVMSGQRAAIKAAELRSAAAHLHDLAQNPMLLTVMAVVHTYKGTLPRERARLYNDCVELLLWNWQRHKQVGPETWELGILHELETREERLVNGLCEVAFYAHQAQGTGTGPANIAESDVIRIIRRYLDGDCWGKAHRFCSYVERQAGLLIGKGKDASGERMFAFPHRGFQEFLAARHLVSDWDFSRRVAELVSQGDMWREVILLATGHLVFNEQKVIPQPLDAINLLVKAEPPTSDAGWRAVWWAAEMLHIVGRSAAEQDEHVGRQLVPRLISQLAMLVSGGHLPPVERAQAGDVLGLLGDPRPGVCTVVPEMVQIEGGTVEIGSEAERHTVPVAPFSLARYPITNAQFRVFVEDGGYNKREYWTARGWEWRGAAPRYQGLLDDPQWGIPNRPIVAVTWHEAIAYTRWLAARTGRPFRLPTEVEWERAAAGTERRKFPWGNRTSAETANHRDTAIGQTVAVGIFPEDRTPEGICDLGGNVWEWCSSLGMDYPYRPGDGREDLEAPGARVLRGGAFDNPRNVLHCTHRRPVEPHAYVALIGFRVALDAT